MKKAILHPGGMLLTGLVLGAASRVLDIYTQNLGNIFSQMAIWILLGVLISIYSETRRKAMGNILPFCLGMLLSYYLAAMAAGGAVSRVFIMGWVSFALFSPVLACFAWMTKQKGLFPGIIRVGIVLVSVLSSLILFDGFRIYDLVINALLIYFLFFKKVRR